MPEQDFLIEADALAARLADPAVRIFDVRHDLFDATAGRKAYEAGHVPGAFFLSQADELSGPMTGTNGRHPLPDRGHVAALMQRCGLSADDLAVVYDDGGSGFAVRAWWLLRWAGHPQVRILNGGWRAWCAAGGASEAGAGAVPAEGPQQLPVSQAMPTISAAGVLAGLTPAGPLLIDARDAPRYHGHTEPLDPVAGHIPGAVNRPIADNLGDDGRFKSAAQLRGEFEALLGGRAPGDVVHYCGSGITACHNLFAMELAGLAGSVLYPGSWSEWCSDAQRPVARD